MYVSNRNGMIRSFFQDFRNFTTGSEGCHFDPPKSIHRSIHKLRFSAMNIKLHDFTDKIRISSATGQIIRDLFRIDHTQYVVHAEFIGRV